MFTKPWSNVASPVVVIRLEMSMPLWPSVALTTASSVSTDPTLMVTLGVDDTDKPTFP